MSTAYKRPAGWVLAVLLFPCLQPFLHAQSSEAPPNSGEDQPIIRDSTVGYIDGAIPTNMFRVRFDSAYGNNEPSRGEFFYARTQPLGPGLPRRETNVDFQDLSLYLEHTLFERFSVFADVPFRAANFTVNDNHTGLADSNYGLKYAFLYSQDTVASFQFRTYVPTGAASRGLGNHHVSLEPSLLLFQRLGERLATESELRMWVPIGGTDFAGNMIRYGVGLRYNVIQNEEWTLAPVVEFVGWTFLDGLKSAPPGDPIGSTSASGDTIINAKIGARLRMNGVGDIYAGYGRALTGYVLYKDIFRIEMRIYY